MKTKTCKQCRKPFTISDSEMYFFLKKGLNPPKRCKECRDKNKAKSGSRQGAPAKTASSPSLADQSPPVQSNERQNPSSGSVDSSGSSHRSPKKHSTRNTLILIVLVIAVFLFGRFFGSSQSTGLNGSSDSGTISSSVRTGDSSSNIHTEGTQYYFRNQDLLDSHFEKHGIEMGFASAEEYETAASAVVNTPGVLHKIEAEDGDDVYYLEQNNDFVIVSTDGYLRTYFRPNGGKEYFDRQ